MPGADLPVVSFSILSDVVAAPMQQWIAKLLECAVAARGGQTFPKSTEITNFVAFRAVFSFFFPPNFSVVAESVSEQLLQLL